jgi:hypothetical protein
MNTLVRLTAGLLFVLLLTAPSITCALTLTIGDAVGSPSEIIEMKVVTEDFADIVALQLFIEYDTTKLEFHSMATSYIGSWTTNVTEGRIIVIWEDWDSPLTLTPDEPLFEFNLQAKPTASGDAAVAFVGYIELIQDPNTVISDPVLNNGVIAFSPTGVDDDASPLPAAFELKQNYPNPFNPATTLAYTIHRTGEYRLEVFNLSGQLVRRIDLGRKMPGAYTLSFSGADLPSGVYTYRLTGENHSSSRQMILLK